MKYDEIRKLIRNKLHIHNIDKPPYGGWRKSPLTGRSDIADIINDLNYDYGAEIGVCKGINSFMFFKHISNLKLICVDPWSAYKAITEERANKRFNIAVKKLENYNRIFIKKTSMEAVKLIEDNTLDFIYIDGLHDFNNVMLDLIHWIPKVKKNGIIAGHDYTVLARGVVRAVDSYVFAHGINDLYITRNQQEESSWFWINK